MLAAGTRTAEVILRDGAHRLASGVAVFAGPGNNGGDAYVVAAQLARAGVRVRVLATEPPRTDDARRALAIARQFDHAATGRGLTFDAPSGREQLVVDGLLGTGHRGALRDGIADGAALIAAARARGAMVVALDVPTGLDATTGDVAAGGVSAHITTTYGTIKRGLLVARPVAGRIVLVDIGLGPHATISDGAWHLGDAASVAERVPALAWNAHKGVRGYLALVGGATGMAGAIVLASRAALASGVGLAHAWVQGQGVFALQQSVPQAIAHAWSAARDTNTQGAHALAIGPGLGRSADSMELLRTALDAHPGVPVVLDADALWLVAQDGGDVADRLRRWCGAGRAVVCTPHPGEFARLTGVGMPTDWSARADALADFAASAGATVLLKGTPTLIASPTADGTPARITAVPRGTAVLATGGSGDMLTGIIGTLLAQGVAAADAAFLGATVHGHAAERATAAARGTRGVTLDDVLHAMPRAWHDVASPVALGPGVLAEYSDVAGPW